MKAAHRDDDYAAVPGELKRLSQWMSWTVVPRSDGKYDKKPVDPRTGFGASKTNSSDWHDFETAAQAVGKVLKAAGDRIEVAGIGLALTKDDAFCAVDLDECRDHEKDTIQGWAWSLISKLDSYTEVSPSGRGVRVFVRAKLPGKGGPKTIDGHSVEFYDRKAFVTVTGDHLEGTPRIVAEKQDVIDELLPDEKHTDGQHRAEPVPEKLGPGRREPTLFSLAGTLHRRGLSVEEILASLRAVNEERCEPPKTDQELREIAQKIKERGYESSDLAGNGSGGAGSDGKPTHDELAQRFLSRHPHYAYGQSEWKKYGEGIWRPVPDALVERQILGVLVAAKPEEIKPTSNLLASVSKLARVVVAVPDDEWDADPDILVCTNGTLHVPTRELRLHDPDYHATSGVPYDYDPEALAPTWGRFLRDFVDAETAHFLQEYAGYCLTTDVSHELALWLYGRPGGGRSTFIAGLEAMLGERAGTLGLGEIERSRFALSDVPGKTILTATEQPAGYMKASYVLNSLISGDKLKVEEKFKPAYDLYPKAKLLWAMNELPRVPSANDGLFRRVKVVEIEPIPESERDPEIKEQIKTEGAGILNWALDGLERLRKRGSFEVPDAVRDATARWREVNDVPAMFVAEECETGEGRSVRATQLYLRYQTWCVMNGHKAKSRTHVAEDWRRLGFTPKRDKRGIVWHGIDTKGIASVSLEEEG